MRDRVEAAARAIFQRNSFHQVDVRFDQLALHEQQQYWLMAEAALKAEPPEPKRCVSSIDELPWLNKVIEASTEHILSTPDQHLPEYGRQLKQQILDRRS